ncbi:YjjG family noncanonical pyrimidine nucleotidase [Flavobacteriaceae bacterium F08102]|nr:YjjG family noncanonical pyrimidine nucleotidase [Flavobacteriaceae bacterium F08102]
MQIEHVFFDLDHTLWDFEQNSAKAFDYLFSKHQIKVDLVSFLKVYKPINFDFWKMYREDRISKKELRYQRLKKTFDVLQFTISDDRIHSLSSGYLEQLTNFNHLFEHTVDILEYLKPKYQLHIITNGFSEIQEKKMLNAQIRPYFTHIITSESVGVKKPNPRIFEFAMDLAQCHTQNCMMIGDSLEADIQGAQGVGIQTIFFNSHRERNHNQDRAIECLLEIKHFL